MATNATALVTSFTFSDRSGSIIPSSTALSKAGSAVVTSMNQLPRLASRPRAVVAAVLASFAGVAFVLVSIFYLLQRRKVKTAISGTFIKGTQYDDDDAQYAGGSVARFFKSSAASKPRPANQLNADQLQQKKLEGHRRTIPNNNQRPDDWFISSPTFPTPSYIDSPGLMNPVDACKPYVSELDASPLSEVLVSLTQYLGPVASRRDRVAREMLGSLHMPVEHSGKEANLR